MPEILNSWMVTGLPPTLLPVAIVCAVGGGLLMVLVTRWQGVGVLIYNVATLFIGAYLANLLTGGIWIPLDRYYERPIVMSVVGMVLTSILLLRGHMRRGRNE